MGTSPGVAVSTVTCGTAATGCDGEPQAASQAGMDNIRTSDNTCRDE